MAPVLAFVLKLFGPWAARRALGKVRDRRRKREVRMKPGRKTSELWVTIGTVILGILNDRLNLGIDASETAAAVTPGLYVGGRIVLKIVELFRARR